MHRAGVVEGCELIRHRRGAAGLRFGFGPGLRPVGAIEQLRTLLERESFWARGRSSRQLRRMLQASDAVVSAWRGERLVGFGRATSDGLYRAVLWDVVVAEAEAGRGLGRRIVESLLTAPVVGRAERIYLMTTNCRGFYERLGFRVSQGQELMVKKGSG